MIANGQAAPSDSERAAFEKELIEIIPSLSYFARSLTRSRDAADDLLQQTLYRALVSRQQFTMGTSLRAWTFTIMRNMFYNGVRRKREDTAEPFVTETAQSLCGAEEIERQVDSRRNIRLIGYLTPEHSDTLIATAYLGYDYIRTAAIFGIEVGTAKSRVSRARENLRATLDAKLPAPKSLIAPWKHATRRVDLSDPLYPIAESYEELYALATDSLAARTFDPKRLERVELEEVRGILSRITGTLEFEDAE